MAKMWVWCHKKLLDLSNTVLETKWKHYGRDAFVDACHSVLALNRGEEGQGKGNSRPKFTLEMDCISSPSSPFQPSDP